MALKNVGSFTKYCAIILFMSEGNLLLGILIGVLSYSCLYLGKGIQGLGINGIKARKALKKRESGIWVLGTVLTVIPMFIQWAALIFAPVNVIAPLEGIGLIVLVVFSYFALKEKITKQESVGIACIVIGTFITAYFARSSSDLTLEHFDHIYLIWIFAGLSVIEGLLILVSVKVGYRHSGVIFGFTAGTMMAFQSISKRISVIAELRLLGIILTLVFAVLTLAITQIGFVKAKANQVVSSFTSASILVASIASIFILSESAGVLQFLGIGIIIIGVLFLTVFNFQTRPRTEVSKQLVCKR